MTPTIVTCTDDFVEVMKRRRKELGITHLEMDAKVGLTQGHTSKIEVPDAEWGKRPFQMLMTVNWMLEALGLQLVVMRSDEAREIGAKPVTRRKAHRSGRVKSAVTARRIAWVRTRRAV